MDISLRAHSPLHAELADVQRATYWITPGCKVKSKAVSMQTLGYRMVDDGIISSSVFMLAGVSCLDYSYSSAREAFSSPSHNNFPIQGRSSNISILHSTCCEAISYVSSLPGERTVKR